MVKCCRDCYPCCDFCSYAEHSYLVINGITIKSGVAGCKKHLDEHHQSMARGLGYCEDFLCVKMKEEQNGA